jgi:hypothetical protein
MPFIPESRSRRAWRRQVAEYVLGRVDQEGWIRFHSRDPEARREMLKVAEMLPEDVIVELLEDAHDPEATYLELRLAPAAAKVDEGFRIVPPDELLFDQEAGEGLHTAGREAAGW